MPERKLRILARSAGPMEILILAMSAICVISIRPESFYLRSVLETYTSFSVHHGLRTRVS